MHDRLEGDDTGTVFRDTIMLALAGFVAGWIVKVFNSPSWSAAIRHGSAKSSTAYSGVPTGRMLEFPSRHGPTMCHVPPLVTSGMKQETAPSRGPRSSRNTLPTTRGSSCQKPNPPHWTEPA